MTSCLVSLFQISYRVRSAFQSGVWAERVYRPVYSAEVRTRLLRCFLSACPVFSGWKLSEKMTLLQRFSEMIPKLQSTHLQRLFHLNIGQQLSCSTPVRRDDLHCRQLEYTWNIKFSSPKVSASQTNIKQDKSLYINEYYLCYLYWRITLYI